MNLKRRRSNRSQYHSHWHFFVIFFLGVYTTYLIVSHYSCHMPCNCSPCSNSVDEQRNVDAASARLSPAAIKLYLAKQGGRMDITHFIETFMQSSSAKVFDGSQIGGYRKTFGDTGALQIPLLSILAASSLVPDDVVLEFGTFRGLTTYHLAYNSPPQTIVITVDRNSSAYDYNKANQSYPENYEVGEAFLKSPISSKIRQIIADSTEFDDGAWLRGRVGLAWVDGGHSFDACRNDWMKSLAVLRDGGSILCDDVAPHYWPGVVQCVEWIRTFLQTNSSIVPRGQFFLSNQIAWFLKDS